MFSSKGRFREFACPRKDECLLPTCWFSHEDFPIPEVQVPAEYDPFTAGSEARRPTKRRKLDNDDDTNFDSDLIVGRTITPPPVRRSSPKPSTLHRPVPLPKVSDVSNQEKSRSGPASIRRSVSPPVTTKCPPAGAATQIPVKAEILRPRLLASSADWQSRDILLKTMHKKIIIRNNEIIGQVKQGAKEFAVLRLHPQEIITLALDEETAQAKQYGAGTYQNVMKQRIHAISKLSDKQWRELLTSKVPRVGLLVKGNAEAHALHGIEVDNKDGKRNEIISGLGPAGEITLLRQLHQPLETLQMYGYITEPPTDDQVRKASEALEASAGWEKCDRCGSRFQVFSGRNQEGLLTSGGYCRYHWARAGTGLLNRMDHNTGGKEARHGCCQQPVGSAGCSQAETHVFNDKDPNRLASIWQWEHTPARSGVPQPISFDCEMAYTALGMEVVRVTAVSWPQGQTLLDVLVRPYGEVLDLNTRFSGVSKKIFAETPRYEDDIGEATATVSGYLQKVSSPAEARKLLFDLIAPETPLIGHAIDNDLNTLRIIHPFVIDTVLLYPHKRGLPMRNSLRILAFEHLDGRVIQSVNNLGHDSKEDAIATGDLVTKAVKAQWTKMKIEGWRVQDGVPFKDGSDGSKL